MKVKQELTAALASAFASKSAGDRSEVFSRLSAAALNAGITLQKFKIIYK